MELNTSQPRHSQIISKPTRNPIVIILLIIMALGLVLFGVLLWQRMLDLDSVRAELASLQHQLQQSQQKFSVSVTPDTRFRKFIDAYNDILSHQSSFVTDADRTAVLAGAKEYYKSSSLPEGTALLAIYSDGKSTDGHPRRAVVYYPASEQKPASFIDMIEGENGKWLFNEYR